MVEVAPGQLRMWNDGGYPKDIPFLVIGRYYDHPWSHEKEEWEIFHDGKSYTWETVQLEQLSRVLDEAR